MQSRYLVRLCLFLSVAAAILGCSADNVTGRATDAESTAAEPSVEPAQAQVEGAVAQEEATEPATVMLALDTSLSMEAEDTAPSRILGATAALNVFLDEVSPETLVGLVSFNGNVTVEVLPTTDRAAMRSAMTDMQLDEETAIGDAIITSIQALESFAIEFDGEAPPARIVLLSDGETTSGRPDSMAIIEAQNAGITVSTIVFGTDAGTFVPPEGGQPVPVPINKEALVEIADATGGEFFEAETTAALIEIFAGIGASS